MIRLVQRKLIIPRGDTGSFTVPALASATSADIAVFTIFNCLTHSKVCDKIVPVTDGDLIFNFTHNDTVNLPVGNYVWDIKFYKDPEYVDDQLINGTEVDSYYAGYKLPECEIRETGDNLLVSEDAPTGKLTADQLDIIDEAITTVTTAAHDAHEAVEHYPKIENGNWYLWDVEQQQYVDTGIQAEGITPIKGEDYWTEEDKEEIKDTFKNDINSTINRAGENFSYAHNLVPWSPTTSESSLNLTNDQGELVFQGTLQGNRITVSNLVESNNSAPFIFSSINTKMIDGHTYRWIMHPISSSATRLVTLTAYKLIDNIQQNISYNAAQYANGDRKIDINFVAADSANIKIGCIFDRTSLYQDVTLECYLQDLTEETALSTPVEVKNLDDTLRYILGYNVFRGYPRYTGTYALTTGLWANTANPTYQSVFIPVQPGDHVIIDAPKHTYTVYAQLTNDAAPVYDTPVPVNGVGVQLAKGKTADFVIDEGTVCLYLLIKKYDSSYDIIPRVTINNVVINRSIQDEIDSITSGNILYNVRYSPTDGLQYYNGSSWQTING